LNYLSFKDLQPNSTVAAPTIYLDVNWPIAQPSENSVSRLYWNPKPISTHPSKRMLNKPIPAMQIACAAM